MHFQYIQVWFGQRTALRAFHVTLGRVDLHRADRWRPGPASQQSTRNAVGAQSDIVKTQVGQAPTKCCTNHGTIVGPRGDVMQLAPVLAFGWSSVHILATLSDCSRLFRLLCHDTDSAPSIRPSPRHFVVLAPNWKARQLNTSS